MSKKKPAEAPVQVEPTQEEKDAIQEGLNKAGQKAVNEMQNPELKKAAELMSKRLGKIDAFIDNLIKEEGSDNLSPQQVTELLMIKARHNAFVHTADLNCYRVVTWLIEMVMFNADAVFAVTKAHLVAQSAPEVDENNPENAEIPQKQEKKSRKKK